jgi:hypothetical protein
MTRRGSLLVLVLVLLPALLSGCGVLGRSGGGSGGADPAAGPGAAGDSWIVSAQGSATPSSRPGYPAAAATPTATTGRLPLGAVAPARTPIPTCSPNTFKFSRIAGLDVTPGATSAVLSWYNVGGSNLVEFRLYATSQDLVVGAQRDVGFVTVPPKTPCGQMSAPIGNLSRGTTYVFTVDAVVLRRSGDGTHAATVARSHPVRTG